MYIGRFAPSPTGPLHIGSLLAAVISYLDAKANQGQWLVRIDDIDPPREQPGASSSILSTLEKHNLHWDKSVLYQSKRHDAYQEAIEKLLTKNAIYPCQCSRKQLSEFNGKHPNACVQPFVPDKPYALRATPNNFQYLDLYQGKQQGNDGHFVVKRRDQLFSYQLAATVDDHHQNISHVIRGFDLLDSTPKQLLLYQALSYHPPEFGHFPVIIASNGQKLSKQNLAPAIDHQQAKNNLLLVMKYLGFKPPKIDTTQELLAWAIEQWKREPPTILRNQSINHTEV